MHLYTEYDKWVLWLQDADNTHLYFDTEMEAKQAMAKIDLAKAIVYQTQLHAKIMDENPDVLQEYFDSGYTYIDADLESLGITATELVNCLTLLENSQKFYTGNNPLNSVYRTTVNKIRRA